MDEKFLQKAFKVAEDHLDDLEFTVEQFVRSMTMSHMQLYRKGKALVNFSAIEIMQFGTLPSEYSSKHHK